MRRDRSEPGTGEHLPKRLADYAMILDMVGQVTGLGTEREQVEKIFDILAMVCGPRSLCFMPLGDGASGNSAFCRPADVDAPSFRERLEDFSGDFRLTESGAGFLMSIKRNEEVLGVLEADGVSEPSLINHYVDVALNLRGIMALAISNARLFQHELENRARIHNYVNQLAVLHDIGLSINREADRDTMLAGVLDGAARLTNAGYGCISLMSEEGSRVVTFFQASWFRGDPPHIDEMSDIGRRLAALGEESERDSVYIADVREVGLTPAPGYAIDGLAGFLRDTRRRIRCQFLLMDKPVGQAFSVEDVDIISLLAAQGSVALASLEIFQREHQLAGTLLDAILPAIPVRDDIEVGLSYRSSGVHGVGGDFYDFIDLDGGRMAVAVGDVSGKGLQAATYNAMVKYMLRAFLSRETDPGACLIMLNQALSTEIPLDKFITMGLVVIDPGAATVAYASAGHLEPFLCAGVQPQVMRSPGTLPLGVLTDFEYDTENLQLDGSSTLVMYTDGIIEARSPEGESFGLDRLRDMLGSCDAQPPQQVVDGIVRRVAEFCEGQLKDDAAIVAVRIGGV